MRVVALLGAALLLAGCGAGAQTKTVTTTTTVAGQQPTAAPGPQNATYFGQPVSVSNAGGGRYLLVLKPQSYLVGVTANTASAQQQGTTCAPLSCPGVDDDRLVVPAGSQSLTFVLPAKTTGTVLELVGSGGSRAVRISGAQLAAVVGGATTPKLVEPLDSGIWLAVNVDTVTSFAQQFQP
jgi:hypothetical protein